MREIILDTETTGLDPKEGHRLVEIAGLELVDRLPSGCEYQTYFNPERDIPREAREIHGLTTEFLKDHPVFAQKVDDFLSFIGDSPLIIHNAEFDLGFLNSELVACGRPPLDSNPVVDTLLVARNMFPGAPASLDALCKRFGIDHQHRQKHSALIDCHLLAKVYLELTGGRQNTLSLTTVNSFSEHTSSLLTQSPDMMAPNGQTPQRRQGEKRQIRPHMASSEEQAAHTRMLQRIKNPLWHEKG